MSFTLEGLIGDFKTNEEIAFDEAIAKRPSVALEDINIVDSEFSFEEHDLEQDVIHFQNIQKMEAALEAYNAIEEKSDLDFETLVCRLENSGLVCGNLDPSVTEKLLSAVSMEKAGILEKIGKKIKDGFNAIFNKTKHRMDQCDDLLKVIKDLGNAQIGEDTDVNANMTLGVSGKVNGRGVAEICNSIATYYGSRDARLASAFEAAMSNDKGALFNLGSASKLHAVIKDKKGYLSYINNQNLFSEMTVLPDGNISGPKVVMSEGDVESEVPSLKEIEAGIKVLRNALDLRSKSEKARLPGFSGVANEYLEDGNHAKYKEALNNFLGLFYLDGQCNLMSDKIFVASLRYYKDCISKYK